MSNFLDPVKAALHDARLLAKEKRNSDKQALIAFIMGFILGFFLTLILVLIFK
jgi:hypothetical protein